MVIQKKLRHWLKNLATGRPQSQPVAAEQPLPTLGDDLAAENIPSELWQQQLQTEKRLYIELPASTVEQLKNRFPKLAAQTLAAAETLLSHRFDLLGSTPYIPQDSDRAGAANGYCPIDWYLDPVSQLRFPQGVPHKQWNLYEMRPGNADIKLPWELARCQHWATLGQAYRLSQDDRYALEIAHQLDDFMQANPVGIGINWTCAMDVALRVLNWAVGLALIKHCNTLPPNFWARAYQALFDHGVFIYHNLENNYEVTSNHFLSNVVGLYYLAAVFKDLPQGRLWNDFCRKSLEREIEVQILDDGADFESSLPYHRLVTELFLGAARLAEMQGESLSDAYLETLHKMVSFLVGVMRPDGLMPQVGDADDGRLHILTEYGNWQRQDARHVLAPAALLLNKPAWLQHAGPSGLWEAAWWGFDISRLSTGDEPPSTHYKLYPQVGIAVMRENSHYLLITNGRVGAAGFGNHKHNELLGFEYHVAGAPIFVDPGSYVYTSNFEARNLFRGTAYHNTVTIDGEEQNEMRPEWIFRLFETAHPEHLAYNSSDTHAEYRGRHTGYQRLENPVTHERTFRWFKESGAVLILDRLDGSGKHQLAWHFHCAPGVEVSPISDNTYLLKNDNLSIVMQFPQELVGEINEAWYSPSYGARIPCRAIDLKAKVTLSGNDTWFFAIGPEHWFEDNSYRSEKVYFFTPITGRGGEPNE